MYNKFAIGFIFLALLLVGAIDREEYHQDLRLIPEQKQETCHHNLIFGAGGVLGVIGGVALMCLLQINRSDDQ